MAKTDAKVEVLDLHELSLDPRNARQRGDIARANLRNSLNSFGAGRSLVLDGQNVVRAGNGTLEAARLEGFDSVLVVEPSPGQLVAVRRPDWDSGQASAYAIADNRLPQVDTTWDDLRLAEILESIPRSIRPATGFSDENLESILATLADRSGGKLEPFSTTSGNSQNAGSAASPLGGDREAKTTSEIETPASSAKESVEALHSRLVAKWKTAPGQLWEVPSILTPGRKHRIFCGDCRNWEDIHAVWDGAAVNGCVTSPPYAAQRSATYGGIHPNQYIDWFENVAANICGILAADASFFLNIDTFAKDGKLGLYIYKLVISMCENWSWNLVDEFCWKRLGPPGKWPDRFKSGWEPVYHFARGKGIKFRPENVAHASDMCVGKGERHEKSTGSGFGCSYELVEGMALPSNVVETHVSQIKGHSAAYPVDLPAFFVKAFSDPGDTWFDPFLGSGTTLVACEDNGRLCLGIERLPEHIAVTLERLAAKGMSPTLAG